ncbi:hypothetical protein SLE2022_094660 [Rubroshorea leprosula]
MSHSNFEDDDDDEEYEEEDGGGNRLLGFMFGNVDNSGDLDVDYLDEDAKEHLSALAEKLGPSLTDMDLLVKSPHTPADAADQDYDEKAEDAVDYEDIDEQYEGPEIQASGEEDHLLPKKEYFSANVSLAILEPKASVFDDENYDEDEQEEKEQEVLGAENQIQTTFSGKQVDCVVATSEAEKYPEDDIRYGSSDTENLAAAMEEFQEVTDLLEEQMDGKGSTPLPVLCVEDGMVILRFSEIFGIHEPMKKREKRDRGYLTHREKYKYMDASDLVEEDEEAFLKGSGQDVSFIRQELAIQQDSFETIDDHTVQINPVVSTQHEEQRKDIYSSPEPMKEGASINFSAGWASPLHQKLFPLDQQDWEEQILWDNSPERSDNHLGSPESSVSDMEASILKEKDLESRLQNPLAGQSMKPDERDHGFSLHSSPVLLESFDSRDSSGSMALPFSKSKFHPQLLRLESQLEVDVSSNVDGNRESAAVERHKSDVVRRFNKLTLQNRAMIEGSWLDNIMWEPHSVIAKPKLILDLQDEQMLFEILDNKDNKHLDLHAGAMIITRSTKPSTVGPSEFPGQKYQSGWQFNIANDKFYKNRKISQQLQPNSNKRVAHGIRVHHSAPALKLQTMKLKLSNKDIANFHRPKALWYPHDIEVAVKEQGKLPTQGPMKVILKSLGGKGSKLNVDAEETVSSVKVKASKKLDFKPTEPVKIVYLGKELEDDKSLAAQNVQPNSLLHLVRARIHPLPRAQKLPGENKALRPPGAFKKKSDLSVKDGHVFLMEYCEERPLLLSNAGMGANLCTYYQKMGPGDQSGGLLNTGNSSLGNVLTLERSDKSPFLGEIKAGCNQSSLETNMYKAPIFQHKVPATDFLLIRSAKGKLSIRRIDKIAVVGQQEPLMEVMSPGSKNLQNYIMNRMLVYVYREFSAAQKRGLPPNISAEDLSACFPNLSEAIIRKKMKDCAFLRRDNNGQTWSMRRDFQIPSEGVLRKLVSPEHVCAYESMQAAMYRLKHLGIARLTHPTGVSSAMSQLPDEAIALAAASHIERELQITPWNLSSNFVACTNLDKENIERLEITGVGDPSGRGLGFSYVRAAPKAPLSSTITKKKTAAARGGSTVTGTDADLRRLSMEAAREVLLKFNVPDDVIAKQTRWHRIAMIRKLSSEQAASGIKVDPTTISKYARGQRMSFMQLQQQTREKCQEIWDRQVQSLSAVDEENESDSEANSDLDSFAGDLENLLDAEEFGDGEEGNNESKYDTADGVKGLKMRRRPSKAQAEEEIEDEAAEAAELCRLLMDDDEAEQKKKKKNKAITGDAGFALGSQSSTGAETLRWVKRANPTPKQGISASQPNGSYVMKESSIRDLAGVESAILKRSSTGKSKGMKKNGTPSTVQPTKVKILGDNPKVQIKEKKSSRESFVCGACGQLGHMRTNKNCPKYGEDPESHVEATEEKASGKSNPLDPSGQSQLKTMKKKPIAKSATKISVVEAPEGEKSDSNIKVHQLKFKCSNDKPSDKLSFGVTQSSDQPVTSDFETGSKSISKVSRIKISNRMKPDEMQVESGKRSIIIRPPVDIDRGQAESSKASVIIRPPASIERDQFEPHRHSIVIRPPTDKDRERSQKKIIIKRPKEIVDLDTFSHDGTPHPEYRKTKKIVELSSFQTHGKHDSLRLNEESVKRHAREERRWWEEEEKRRNAERVREERARRIFEEERRMLEEEQERFAEIKRYEESIRREREEEERQRAKKKKKKKKKVEIKDDYSEDYMSRRNDRRMPERDRNAKRQYGADYGPPTKRRRGGEVGLANVLERIVDTLRDNTEVSYLFLKPVSKKEAPDYLDIIAHPMDLSTIRDKVRRMEYKDRNNFRHDVWQIAFNAHKYNDGRNPGIPPLADQLLELCDYLLEEYHERLSAAEAGIESRDP